MDSLGSDMQCCWLARDHRATRMILLARGEQHSFNRWRIRETYWKSAAHSSASVYRRVPWRTSEHESQVVLTVESCRFSSADPSFDCLKSPRWNHSVIHAEPFPDVLACQTHINDKAANVIPQSCRAEFVDSSSSAANEHLNILLHRYEIFHVETNGHSLCLSLSPASHGQRIESVE